MSSYHFFPLPAEAHDTNISSAFFPRVFNPLHHCFSIMSSWQNPKVWSILLCMSCAPVLPLLLSTDEGCVISAVTLMLGLLSWLGSQSFPKLSCLPCLKSFSHVVFLRSLDATKFPLTFSRWPFLLVPETTEAFTHNPSPKPTNTGILTHLHLLPFISTEPFVLSPDLSHLPQQTSLFSPLFHCLFHSSFKHINSLSCKKNLPQSLTFIIS